MAYTKTTWVNNETAANATNMNNIESGIEANDINIATLLENANRKDNAITLRLTSEKTIPSGISYVNIDTLTSIYSQQGSLFTVGSVSPTSQSTALSGVVIPAGITKVKVSGQMQLESTHSSTASYVVFIYKVSSNGATKEELSRSFIGYLTNGNLGSGACVTSLADVSEGDVIGLRIYKYPSAATCTISDGYRTYLTVEAI